MTLLRAPVRLKRLSWRPPAAVTEVLVAKGFPALLLLCNVGAAVIAFRHREWQRGFYWLASAICIACVAW
jgi:lipoprotein signal peptidase